MQYALVRRTRQQVHRFGYWLMRMARPHARPIRRRGSPAGAHPPHCTQNPCKPHVCQHQEPADLSPQEDEDPYADMPPLEDIPPYEQEEVEGPFRRNLFTRHVTYTNHAQAMAWIEENHVLNAQLRQYVGHDGTIPEYSTEEALHLAGLIARSMEIRNLLGDNTLQVEIRPAGQA
jgi:hypothetical protein